MSTGLPVLEINDVSLAFGGNKALQSVSLSVRSGELVGLIGPNGSGKTTLLNAIGAVYPINSGQILLEGRRLDRLPMHDVARAGVARTFQAPRVFPNMTAMENMLTAGFAVRQAEESRDDLIMRARALLQSLVLESFGDALANTLSGGQRMLLQFARTLMQSPRLLLLDEPFGGVHPKLIETMLGSIRALHAEGLTIIIVSHDLPTVMSLSERIVVLAQGRIIADGKPETVRQDPAVIEAYLGG